MSASPAGDAYWTSLKYLSISRLVIAGVLATLTPLSLSGIGGLTASADDATWLQPITMGYLLAAAAFLASVDLLRPRFRLLLTTQTLVDLAFLAALVHAAGGVRSGFGILMIAPVAGAAILSTPLAAVSFAAIAALALLAETAWRALATSGPDIDFMQAGLTGAACFAAALLVNRLARRLLAQETLARQRGEDLRGQLAINRLVIADLPDGVVVVSRDGRPRTMNRSARQLLDGPSPVTGSPAGSAAAQPDAPDAPGRLPNGWPPVAAAHEAWRAAGAPHGHAIEVALRCGDDGPVRRARLRFLGSPRAGVDCVVVIEDLDRVEQRAQQLKLASMGRLSASIAHEIRNPLGAIRHANGLLGEQLDDARLQRLSAIIEDNSVRINRVVEHVLAIARRERATAEPIDVATLLRAFVPEFAAQHGQPVNRIQVTVETAAPLMFDIEHLRQVLVNLAGNALRYASDAPGAVCIRWRAAAGGRLELSVSDDGPGLTPEQAQHAFEPFHTTEARGTGLGLYLVRELCASNGASIRYERRAAGARHTGAFVIEPARTDR